MNFLSRLWALVGVQVLGVAKCMLGVGKLFVVYLSPVHCQLHCPLSWSLVSVKPGIDVHSELTQSGEDNLHS